MGGMLPPVGAHPPQGACSVGTRPVGPQSVRHILLPSERQGPGAKAVEAAAANSTDLPFCQAAQQWQRAVQNPERLGCPRILDPGS